MSNTLPAEINTHLHHLFGAYPAKVEPLTGGFSHRAWRCTIHAEALVIKAANHEPYRAELWHEAEALIGLDRMGRNLKHARYVAFAHLSDWNVLVQKFVEGIPGIALFGGDARVPARAYRALAQALATLHKHEGAAIRALQNDLPRPNSFSMRNRAAHTRGRLGELGMDASLHGAFYKALAHPAWRRGPSVFCHGDAGLHNVLWRSTGRGGIAALLDWEWAGWGPALCDLAWLNWTMRWRKMDGLWPGVLDAYAAHIGAPVQPSPAAMRALQLGQIAMILLRSRGNPTVHAEWLRRANWTLALMAG